jgi:hypothetical protein
MLDGGVSNKKLRLAKNRSNVLIHLVSRAVCD